MIALAQLEQPIYKNIENEKLLIQTDSKTQKTHLDMYVTVEPCIMCGVALAQSPVHRVFYGCKNQKFGGCGGVYELRANTNRHFPEIKEGYEKERAI